MRFAAFAFWTTAGMLAALVYGVLIPIAWLSCLARDTAEAVAVAFMLRARR
jgi:hypothetical protein